MKRVTIKDVAREAGVSVTLVSFVMNAKVAEDGTLDCPANPDTAARILEIAKRLGYRRNSAAASLRSGRSNSIAVITTDISNKFFAGVSRQIEDTAFKYGYNVLFASSDEKSEKLEGLLDSLVAQNIDGIILAPVEGSEAAIRKVVDANLPVVLLDRDIQGLDEVGKVFLDDKEAGKMAVNYFTAKGMKKIEMVSYSLKISSIAERENGYVSAMKSAGLAKYTNVHHTTYDTLEQDAEKIVEDILARKVEAVFLPTYSLAASILITLKRKDVKVPEDIAIMAFDNSNIYNLYQETIPHIIQPLKDLGEKSVETLLNLIEKKEGEKTFILKPTLVE